MSRKTRILAQARFEGWLCALCISIACAAGAWAAVSILYGKSSGGALLAVLTISALRLAAWHWSERNRLRGRVWREEIQWNPQLVITAARPIKPGPDPGILIGLAIAIGIPALLACASLILKLASFR